MSQAVEPRITVDLPIRVWGMTADGRPFSQHARAQNISSEGALLAGIESELKVGDIIGVQCEEKKTRCTVMWVMNTGPIKKNQVGVKLLADQECPWKTYLPVQGATPTILESNRRRWPFQQRRHAWIDCAARQQGQRLFRTDRLHLMHDPRTPGKILGLVDEHPVVAAVRHHHLACAGRDPGGVSQGRPGDAAIVYADLRGGEGGLADHQIGGRIVVRG